MPRNNFILCSGVTLFMVNCTFAQGLPRNPSIQQYIGFRTAQQQQWAQWQLPANSVLFRMQPQLQLTRPYSFSGQQPVHYFSLQVFASADIHKPGSISMYQQPWPAARIVRSGYASQNNWWMDKENAIGSSILRDIIINNNR